MGSRQSGDRSEAGETKEYVRDEVSARTTWVRLPLKASQPAILTSCLFLSFLLFLVVVEVVGFLLCFVFQGKAQFVLELAVPEAGLELLALLPLPPKRWNYKHGPQHLAPVFLFFFSFLRFFFM